jgi:hypothetical protein
MAWIKRNLFFVVGGIVAVMLLGAAAFYDFQSWQRNSAAIDKLNEIYGTIKEAASAKPSPGNDKVDNIAAAREQERQLREWMHQAADYFQPIAPIPAGNMTSEAFAAALRTTIHELQEEAIGASVTLPPDYAFSFTAQRIQLQFAPGSLEPLSVQVGEVKAISKILFAARVNSLDSIQRVRVSDDDTAGPQSDYIDDQPVTTDLAVATPYVITFRAFSPEVGEVLANFASSPHGFIVKGINVQPAGAASAAGSASAQPATPVLPPPGRDGLQTVLKEQMLRITLAVDVVKLK